MSLAPLVVVTGATGFIGRHLLPALRSAGYRVRALVGPGRSLASEGVEVRPVASLTEAGALTPLLDGAAAVLHFAGRAHRLRDMAADPAEAFRAANVAPTEALAVAARAAGVRQFVFASSLSVVGPTSDVALTAESPTRPATPYGRSKLEAEQRLHALAAGGSMAVAVLRLPMVYGPGMRGNPLRLFRLVARGWPVPFGAVRNRRSQLYVGELARVLVAVLARAPVAGTFYAADAEDLSTPEFTRRAARALGVTPRMLPVPPVLFRAAGALGSLLPAAIPFPRSREAAIGPTCSLFVDTTARQAASGWRPQPTVDAAFATTAQWVRAAWREGGA